MGQKSGTWREKSYLEKFNYLDSSQVGGEGQSQQQEERNGCKGTEDFFASCKKPHGARFAMGKQATWCRALKNRVRKNRGEEQGCMQDRKRKEKH